MPCRSAIILVAFLVLTSSCGRDERGPMLAGGREVKSWVEDLKDRDPKKRRVAVLKLGNVGDADPTAADALADVLLDVDGRVRRDAVFAVAKLKTPGETIISRLHAIAESDKESRTRDLAKKALTRIESR